MEGFDFVYREHVRFKDVDAMGHVNNAVYLTYLEEARIAFLRPLGPTYENLILARTEIDFRSPVRGGEDVEVGVRCTRLGSSSFDLRYEVWASGRLVAEAQSVQVSYDYEVSAPAPIPDEWREALAA